MIKKIFLPVFLVLVISLIVSFSSAQFSTDYKQAKSIICGNDSCERAEIEIKIGEQKTIQLGEKSYIFKLIRIDQEPQKNRYTTPEGVEKEDIYYNYRSYFSIDGSEPIEIGDMREKLDFNIDYSVRGDGRDGPSPPPAPTTISLYFQEDKICMVPDCGFKVEANIYKKWNLVPMYLLGIGGGMNIANKGTCKQEDFLVIYAHDPVKKEFVKLYSYGQTGQMPTQDFQERVQQGVFALSPFNSAWVYARKECNLVMEMPKPFENLLLLLQQLMDQAERQSISQPAVERPIEKVPISGKAVGDSGESSAKIGFAPGWNFFMGSKDMEGQPLGDIRGTCTIEKAYTFEGKTQSWKKLSAGVGPESGFVFKVKDKCMLGLTELIAPPSIPVSGG